MNGGRFGALRSVLRKSSSTTASRCLKDQFWSQTVDGLTLGAIYALIALGYTLVYGVLRLINFAHSEIFMIGVFASLVRHPRHGHQTATRETGLRLVARLLVAAGRGAWRPRASPPCSWSAWPTDPAAARRRRAWRRSSPPSASRCSSRSCSPLRYGRDQLGFPRVLEKSTLFNDRRRPSVRTDKVLVFVAALVLMVALDRFVARTRLGRGIRATAQDPETAALDGRQHRPGRHAHVPPRRHPGRRRRLALRHLLRDGPVQHRLPARHQGVHRGRARRHRQHPRRARRRPASSACSRTTARPSSAASGRTCSPSSSSSSC